MKYVEENEPAADSPSGVFDGIKLFFQLIFSLLGLLFWLAVVVGIIAFIIWVL